MLFNSFAFLVFLPVVFLLYWFVFRGRREQNLLIVVASYVFYGWWDWRFLFLIALTSACSYASGLLIAHYEGHRKSQRLVSAANIVFNLSILGVFKYYGFFIDNLRALFALIGWQLDVVTLQIILPVGISFYTFQALSYTIDVYRGQLPATRDIIGFFAYISFFPQLVAGPIERATNLLPQFQTARRFDYAKAADGCRQALWGFVKKILIADPCGQLVNAYWGQGTLYGVSIIMLWVLFAFQIYCDFSGYSDIAIGCARLFGFDLMRNFSTPYFSRSIPEFWRRWHISLTTWFRDYIYFPLGGSRCSRGKTIRNIFIVWCVSGLWHGADWTFVCWGLYHAVLLLAYNLLGIQTKHAHIVAHGRLLPSLKEIFHMLCTFMLAVIGWCIFRAESMGQVVDIFSALFHNPFIDMSFVYGSPQFACCLVLLAVEWWRREKRHALETMTPWPILNWTLYAVLVFFAMAFGASSVDSDFIYFQF
ncbi:MAG: MBOAT family protein [Alloprevotella sp.]|nr:MBOAT family protein [Alloprevotella sp.]